MKKIKLNQTPEANSITKIAVMGLFFKSYFSSQAKQKLPYLWKFNKRERKKMDIL